jgi:4a-hydroxytetrahydrobiopterin dehydratase
MERKLGRQEASDAVGELGWRYLLGALRTSVPTGSLARATELASALVAASGDDADRHLRIDVRAEQLVLILQTLDLGAVTARDVDLARRLSAAVRAAGLRTEAGSGAGGLRSVQMLEIAVDALDIAAVRPFWKAVLGYADEPMADDPPDAAVDPLGQGPAIWFQQMDQPRPQRNRIHLDICVPHDQAAHRIESALAAGGHLVSDEGAPAFWILADAEGNEACVTTWQGRDPQG